MKHKLLNEVPMLRLVSAVTALSTTLSIGGFIDFLADSYVVVADTPPRPVLSAEWVP